MFDDATPLEFYQGGFVRFVVVVTAACLTSKLQIVVEACETYGSNVGRCHRTGQTDAGDQSEFAFCRNQTGCAGCQLSTRSCDSAGDADDKTIRLGAKVSSVSEIGGAAHRFQRNRHARTGEAGRRSGWRRPWAASAVDGPQVRQRLSETVSPAIALVESNHVERAKATGCVTRRGGQCQPARRRGERGTD